MYPIGAKGPHYRGDGWSIIRLLLGPSASDNIGKISDNLSLPYAELQCVPELKARWALRLTSARSFLPGTN